ADLIGPLRELLWGRGRLVSAVRPGREEAGAKFADYFEFAEPFTRLPTHRILALFRGEKEEVLDVAVDPGEPADYEARIAARFGVALDGRRPGDPGGLHQPPPGQAWLGETVRWAWKTRISVHLGLDVRTRLRQAAEDEALRSFAPTCAALCPDRLVAELVRLHPDLGLTKVVVSEAGASVYSASAYAGKELPGLDVSLRGAVSIARRLQDPLAELVKIDPKSIGVGQYQHDVAE